MNNKALEFLEKRIQYHLDNFDGRCDTLNELYNIKTILTREEPAKFEFGYGYFFSYELYKKCEGSIHSEKYKAIDNVQVEATSPYNNIGVIGNFAIRPEWCVKKENLLELKADVDKAINLLNKIKERMETDELH